MFAGLKFKPKLILTLNLSLHSLPLHYIPSFPIESIPIRSHMIEGESERKTFPTLLKTI